jgi:hypothetical protein
VAFVARHGLRLSAMGRRAAAADWIDVPAVVVDAGSDPDDVDAGEVALLLSERYVDVPAALEAPARRYLDLLDDARRRPVGLFELPVE